MANATLVLPFIQQLYPGWIRSVFGKPSPCKIYTTKLGYVIAPAERGDSTRIQLTYRPSHVRGTTQGGPRAGREA